MSPDLAMVIGVVLGVLSVPAILSAFSEGHAPRVAAFTILVGGSLVLWALTQKPGGYTLIDIPNAFVRVMAQFLG